MSKTQLNVMQYMATQGIMGGVENHVLTLCEQLDRRRINVQITCPVEDRGDDLQRRAGGAGIPLHGFPAGRGKRDYAKRMIALARLLRREKTDVLHIHACGFSGANAFVAAALARVPTVIVSHHSWFGPRPHNRQGQLSLWLEKRIATRIITLYSAQAEDMKMAGARPSRVLVVPMGVDLSKFEVQERPIPGPADPFRVAIVARLVAKKGHDELLHALARLAPRYPNLRLRIIGDGPQRAHLEQLAVDLGLTARVEMVGQVANKDVPAHLHDAHAIALPTYVPGEAFPNTLIEGMAMGLPAIGSRIGGIPDMIVEGETGYVVEPEDVDSLTRALEALAADPTHAAFMGRAAHARAESRFSTTVLGRTITALYFAPTGSAPAPTATDPVTTTV